MFCMPEADIVQKLINQKEVDSEILNIIKTRPPTLQHYRVKLLQVEYHLMLSRSQIFPQVFSI